MDTISNFSWSQRKLWSLKIPPIEMEISQFTWLLDYPIWATNYPESTFDLKPIDVLNNITDYPTKQERVSNADLSFPVFAIIWHNKYVIIDGFHRVLKSLLNEKTCIGVKIVTPDMISRISPDLNDSDIKKINFDIYNDSP